jgi:hypothetical protein
MNKSNERASAARHTPGPWEAIGLESDHDSDRSIMARTPIHGNPLAVARAYGGGILAPADPERVANARLIAAAPDLLAACKAADAQVSGWRIMLAKAILKAEGGRP